jgi:hypothetical protein
MCLSSFTLRSTVLALQLVGGLVLGTAPASAQAGIVQTGAIQGLVQLAQQQAQQANDDAIAQAEQAQEVLDAKRELRAEEELIESTKEKIAREREAAEQQLEFATASATANAAIGMIGSASSASTCAATDDALAPSVAQAMSSVSDAIATGKRIAKAARRRMAETNGTAARRVLEAHAAWVEAMIARQQDLRTTLRALAKAVAARRSC